MILLLFDPPSVHTIFHSVSIGHGIKSRACLLADAHLGLGIFLLDPGYLTCSLDIDIEI